MFVTMYQLKAMIINKLDNYGEANRIAIHNNYMNKIKDKEGKQPYKTNYTYTVWVNGRRELKTGRCNAYDKDILVEVIEQLAKPLNINWNYVDNYWDNCGSHTNEEVNQSLNEWNGK